jgi:uncharacterized protein (TIGR04255 family)
MPTPTLAMKESHDYKRPPIVEAVIELQFSQPLDADSVNRTQKLFSKDFPIVQALSQFEIQVNQNIQTPTITQKQLGYRIDNADSTDIILITNVAIAYSRLAPYNGWNLFSAAALSALDTFRREIGLVQVKRIGLRYINRIDIPLPSPGALVQLEDYLTIHPQFLEDSFPPLQGFTMQTVFGLANNEGLATITVASVPSPLPTHMGIILDIDVARSQNLPKSQSDIRDLLNIMRDEKNSVFESCITKATKELFDQ